MEKSGNFFYIKDSLLRRRSLYSSRFPSCHEHVLKHTSIYVDQSQRASKSWKRTLDLAKLRKRRQETKWRIPAWPFNECVRHKKNVDLNPYQQEIIEMAVFVRRHSFG